MPWDYRTDTWTTTPPWQAKLRAQERGNTFAVSVGVVLVFLAIMANMAVHWMGPELSCLAGCVKTTGEVTGMEVASDDRGVRYRFMVDGQSFEGRGLGERPLPVGKRSRCITARPTRAHR
jgi:hypothetical protein